MEETALKWSNISDAEKKELIAHLTSNLKTLRAKGNLTQEDIANAIGISRQTYSMIECQKTPMTWNLYLSIVFLFSSRVDTKELLEILGIFPNSYMELESRTEK